MSPLGDDHALEGCGGGLRVVQGRHRNPTHGRQGKRPAVSAAYVVGWIRQFADITDTPCWRFLRFRQRFQCAKR
ncbi:MAG TPA: hypothetical protein VMC10_17120, partial [Stellaceae bacterium]|nr:hypothetical protein [Stellaceae bacterium]